MKDFYNIFYKYEHRGQLMDRNTGWVPAENAIESYLSLHNDAKASELQVVKQVKTLVTSVFEQLLNRADQIRVNFTDNVEMNRDIAFLLSLSDEQTDVFYQTMREEDPSFDTEQEDKFRQVVESFRSKVQAIPLEEAVNHS